jgi:hypothetical protein
MCARGRFERGRGPRGGLRACQSRRRGPTSRTSGARARASSPSGRRGVGQPSRAGASLPARGVDPSARRCQPRRGGPPPSFAAGFRNVAAAKRHRVIEGVFGARGASARQSVASRNQTGRGAAFELARAPVRAAGQGDSSAPGVGRSRRPEATQVHAPVRAQLPRAAGAQVRPREPARDRRAAAARVRPRAPSRDPRAGASHGATPSNG